MTDQTCAGGPRGGVRWAWAVAASALLGGGAAAHPLGWYIYRTEFDQLVVIFPFENYWPIKYRIPPYFGYLDGDYPFEEALWDRPSVGLYQTHANAKIEFVMVNADPGVYVRDPADIQNAVHNPGETFVIGTTGTGFLSFPWYHLDEGDPNFVPNQEGYDVTFYIRDRNNLHTDSVPYTFHMYPALYYCPSDLTGSAFPGSPEYGIPNGVLNSDDFFYYLIKYTEGYAPVADLTATSLPGTPGYGIPDAIINNDDFFYYLALYVIGC